MSIAETPADELAFQHSGDADLKPGSTPVGEIRFHNGDKIPFTARRR